MVVIHETDLPVFLYVLMRDTGVTEETLTDIIDYNVTICRKHRPTFSHPELEAAARRLTDLFLIKQTAAD